jgi:type I restriction enzyme S subunit
MNKLFQNVPEDWQISKIGNFTTNVEYGISKSMNSEKVGVPILRMNNLNGEGYTDYTDLKYVDIPEDMVQKFSLEKDDILFNRVNSVKLVGKTSIIKKVIKNMVFASYLIRVNVNNEKLLPDYLNYYLNSYLGTIEINRNLRRASSQANINAKELRLMRIIIPPIAEQFKITFILSNLDKIIKNTNTIIKNLQILKKGLMQHLFTEGIGHTEFKETRVGRIPEEWDVVRFIDLALKFLGGGTPSTNISKYWDGGIPWMTSAILDKMYINNGMRYITEEGLKKSASNLIPKGSLLISTRVGIGKVGIAGIDVAISQDLTGVVIDLEKSLTEFLYWFFLNSQNKLINISQGTTVKGIERKSLKILKIPLPPLPEQENITKILNNLNNKIINQRNYQSKLKKIKIGLMQNLLTGKKRVRIN